MIYLIGGPPRCGKTTVARVLAQRVGCSRLPVDYLTSAFMGYVSSAEEQRLFPREGVRGDARFARFSAEQIIANYRTKAHNTWLGLRSVIEYAIADKHTMVFEGYQIEPHFVAELRQLFPAETRVAFLYREDVTTLQADLQRGTADDWLIRETHEPQTWLRVAEMIAAYSAIIRAEAARYQLPCMDMGRDFGARMAAVVDALGD